MGNHRKMEVLMGNHRKTMGKTMGKGWKRMILEDV
jgi:hypothetical protein